MSPSPPPPIHTAQSPTNTYDTSTATVSATAGSVFSPASARSQTPFSPFPPTPSYDDDVVESPSLTSGNALARFEFEKPPGGSGARESGNGTKVLMVEWEDDASTQDIMGHWAVGWEGAVRATVPTSFGSGGGGRGRGRGQQQQKQQSHSTEVEAPRSGSEEREREPDSLHPDQDQDHASRGESHRLYFLLPAGERVPGTVTLALEGTHASSPLGSVGEPPKIEKLTWRTHPLPAIFSPQLGATARESGKKGVLHTVWAKKRLEVLRAEIEHEARQNSEGVALQMAVQEREWIESNFGVKTKPRHIDISAASSLNVPSADDAAGAWGGGIGMGLQSPSSPRSPGRGPLLEKMKGLKLNTSPSDATAPPVSKEQNPLSPEGTDVAVSSFGSFAAISGLDATSSLAAKAPQRSSNVPPTHPSLLQKKIATVAPPDSVLFQQHQQSQTSGSMGSLNAFATAPPPPPPVEVSGPEVQFREGSQPHQPFGGDDTGDEDELFALPLSPRSPEKGGVSAADGGARKFTFESEDTERYFATATAER